MKTVVLSIKPKYAARIMAGEKWFEYRRKLPKQPFDKVWVYASAPIKRVVLWFTPAEIISLPLAELWACTEHRAGISKEDFDKYFTGCEIGHAIGIGPPYDILLPEPTIETLGVKPPQSFCYLPEVQK